MRVTRMPAWIGSEIGSVLGSLEFLQSAKTDIGQSLIQIGHI